MKELTDAAYHMQMAIRELRKAHDNAENQLESWAIEQVLDKAVKSYNDIDTLSMSVDSTRRDYK